MKVKAALLVALVCCIGFSGANAQIIQSKSVTKYTTVKKKAENYNRFSIKFGGTMPMGSFGSLVKVSGSYTCGLFNYNKVSGGAKFGWNGGLSYSYNIGDEKGLGVVVAADFIYNGLKEDLRDYDEEILPNYMQAPLTLGVGYTYTVVDEMLDVYGEAGAGMCYRMISDYDCDVLGLKENISYNSTFSFAYRAGLGIIVADHITIGVDYYGLGSPQISGTDKLTPGGKSKFTGKSINASVLLFRAGVCF